MRSRNKPGGMGSRFLDGTTQMYSEPCCLLLTRGFALYSEGSHIKMLDRMRPAGEGPWLSSNSAPALMQLRLGTRDVLGGWVRP